MSFHGKMEISHGKLRKDLRRAYELADGTGPERFLECLRSPGVHAVVIYRFRQWLRQKNLPLRILLAPAAVYLDYRMRSKWGIEIHTGADIGGGFVIGHHGGIFISSKSVIGENLKIAHDVTIGTDGTGANYGAPTIGDNVGINAGAKVNGKIKIGHNVRIGPNAVVHRSVPDNALVHTRPMQVVAFPNLYGSTGGSGYSPAEDPTKPSS
jgi:serine O-acetyltransferase